jgi:hypothetical protein
MAGCGTGLRARCALTALAATAAVAALAAAPAVAMRTKTISPHLCKTVNGGRFVPIPGFPGEKIDRRLLPDIRWMKRRFDIFITDGYSRDPVHAENGEHPIGLATDIVPDKAEGGTWNEIGDLAHLAEPHQDEPIMPWRWVGWNGDPGHGRGNHLHLSWSHSPSKPGHPARVVYTRFCPGSGKQVSQDGDGHHRHHHGGSSGGTSAGSGGDTGSGGTGTGGGGGAASPKIGKLAPVVAEDL